MSEALLACCVISAEWHQCPMLSAFPCCKRGVRSLCSTLCKHNTSWQCQSGISKRPSKSSPALLDLGLGSFSPPCCTPENHPSLFASQRPGSKWGQKTSPRAPTRLSLMDVLASNTKRAAVNCCLRAKRFQMLRRSLNRRRVIWIWGEGER